MGSSISHDQAVDAEVCEVKKFCHQLPQLYFYGQTSTFDDVGFSVISFNTLKKLLSRSQPYLLPPLSILSVER